MRRLIGYLADAHLEHVSSRVASRIVSAVSSFGVETPRGIELSVRLSQSELALMVGASRQTVNKVLQQFQAERLLNTEYGTLIIHDVEGLRRQLGGE